jgi:hypothetical protein
VAKAKACAPLRQLRHADEKLALGAFKLADLVSKTKDSTHPKPFVEGKQVTDWVIRSNNWLEWDTYRTPRLFRRQTFPEVYMAKAKLPSNSHCWATGAPVP